MDITRVNKLALEACIKDRELLVQFYVIKDKINAEAERNFAGLELNYLPVFDESLRSEYAKLEDATWKQRCATISQVAEMCGVGKSTLHKWKQRGIIRAYRMTNTPTLFVCIDDVIREATTSAIMWESRSEQRKSRVKKILQES